jgi:FdhD protein
MAQDKLDSIGVVDVSALYLSDRGSSAESLQCQVVKEDALTLKVADVGNYILMWTPTTNDEVAQGFTPEDGLLGEAQRPEGLCLALGFALSEGLIETLADIKSISVCSDDTSVVELLLQNPEHVHATRKNLVINSSCGICGPREILENNSLALHPAQDTLRISHRRFQQLMSQMRDKQTVFEQTGGSHAAAIFDESGKVLSVAEDLGRHNAMDKAIGIALVQRGTVAGCGVVLSSRVSLEMVLKAIRAGLELVLAVSAPTSLAIEVADKFGVTLCGFVRDQRATLYTHPQRVRPADASER